MKFAVDLYSGIGGWTLGMKLSDITNLQSFEWWKEANRTHNINFQTEHQEVDIRKIDIQKDLRFKKDVDFVVGSPPCTQFSYANRGGDGDIQDGLVDIYKFLEVVEYLKPKYWAMENVPRVANIIKHEIENGSLKRFKKLFTVIEVFDSADFGLPQHRKRMIAGNFPVDLLKSYKSQITKIIFDKVLKSLLDKTKIRDPNYDFDISSYDVTELDNEPNLTDIEIRINQDAKTFHTIYNKMSFPDKLDRPSRTITATCTRVSRESIIIKTTNGYRRLNIREKGVLQGFPITYQFYGNSYSSKNKMIGNAVPPILTYYIFQSMLETQVNKLKHPKDSSYFHNIPEEKAKPSKLGLPKKNYPKNRTFKFAVPSLRYGSGVRFELSNIPNAKWSFKFFFGSSKNIKSISLDNDLLKLLEPTILKNQTSDFEKSINEIIDEYQNYTSKGFQDVWVSTSENAVAFKFIDSVGSCVNKIIDSINWDKIDDNIIFKIINEKNKKLSDNKESVLTGFYLLSLLNNKVLKK